jgi:hypothetical protein
MLTLKTLLRINAASCLGFGALFIALPQRVTAFLGAPPAPTVLLIILGALLIINGVHLLHTSCQALPPKALILYFSGGDFAWVVGTLALIAGGLWITRPAGVTAALLVGTGVGAMGLMQLVTRKRLETHQTQ